MRLARRELSGPVKSVSEFHFQPNKDSLPHLTQRQTYTEKGWLLIDEDFDEQEQLLSKNEYEWDERGYLMGEKYYEITPNHPVSIKKFLLDEWGRTVEIQILNPEGEVIRSTRQTFNAAHQVTKRIAEEETAVFKYEKDTLLIEARINGPDNDHFYYTYQYDEQGRNTEAVRNIHEFGEDYYMRFVQAFDARGNQIEQTIYQGTPEQLNFRWTKEFNYQDQEVLLVHRDSTDQPEYEIVTTWDAAGNRKMEERWEYDENGEKFLASKEDLTELVDTLEREEDEYGNWLRFAEYYGDSLVEERKRVFEYWK